jgi:hypothetical protein
MVTTGRSGDAYVKGPKTMWRLSEGWKYRHPEYHEPSRYIFLGQRLSGWLVLIILVALIWLILGGIASH